ncbi:MULTISPECIES: hypothetical protein [Pseudonocardiaceae]|uniref:Uncharacterized protein n=5 Tax=Pseudonocardiaceae TaxID=2070 RepID=A0A8E1W592_9PSEU|nr:MULTISPECIES: hypothetical protein [Pseudonocardiaceae]PXY16835.1 hypothetical protein BAY59_37955 [Prauserella coralliicola]AXB46130.1 hypothetical protein A4R43_29690 [Amycolatopsis albispora]MBB2504096.1 hypothetical protein [Amycolatopsis echigonensis]MCF6426079.1 hypothetical protein [Amycolatopsis tucumanensis]PXY25630.1 hypothetical protein BA062_26195 [Prauserella flavalba]
MATTEEIERRVEQADAARSAKRAAAAKRVGELALLRAEVAEKLGDVERELGDVLAESSDVISVDELAKFTDVPATDLTQWLNGRKTTRPKRKRSTAGTATAKRDASQASSTSNPAPTTQQSASPELAGPRNGAADTSTRIPTPVT